MNPRQFADRMHQMGAAVQAAPARVDEVLRGNAAAGAPRGVSVLVQRTASGSRVVVSGPGARAHARRLRRRLVPLVRARVKP
jgi:hypothetical protein